MSEPHAHAIVSVRVPVAGRSCDDCQTTVVVGHLDRLLARGVHGLLEGRSHVRILASGLGPAELERAVATRAPSVVLVGEDVEHALLRSLQARQLAPGLLVLAHNPSRLFATMAAAAGALVVAPSASDEDILAAFERAASRSRVTVLAERGLAWRNANACAPLTAREHTVLEHLRLGRTYAEIGHALHIAPATARTHTVNICRKLDLARKRDLIGYAHTPEALGAG